MTIELVNFRGINRILIMQSKRLEDEWKLHQRNWNIESKILIIKKVLIRS